MLYRLDSNYSMLKHVKATGTNYVYGMPDKTSECLPDGMSGQICYQVECQVNRCDFPLGRM